MTCHGRKVCIRRFMPGILFGQKSGYSLYGDHTWWAWWPKTFLLGDDAPFCAKLSEAATRDVSSFRKVCVPRIIVDTCYSVELEQHRYSFSSYMRLVAKQCEAFSRTWGEFCLACELHPRSLQAAVRTSSTIDAIFLFFQQETSRCLLRGSITNLLFCPTREVPLRFIRR